MGDAAVVGLVAVAAYFLWGADAKAGDLDPVPGEPKDPGPKPAGTKPAGGGASAGHLGTGWQGWPGKDVFPTERSIAQMFQVLGYVSSAGDLLSGGRWVLNAFSRGVVTSFQDDFNVAATGQSWAHPTLEPDGKAGPWTISALLKVAKEAGCSPSMVNNTDGAADVCRATWQGML